MFFRILIFFSTGRSIWFASLLNGEIAQCKILKRAENPVEIAVDWQWIITNGFGSQMDGLFCSMFSLVLQDEWTRSFSKGFSMDSDNLIHIIAERGISHTGIVSQWASLLNFCWWRNFPLWPSNLCCDSLRNQIPSTIEIFDHYWYGERDISSWRVSLHVCLVSIPFLIHLNERTRICLSLLWISIIPISLWALLTITARISACDIICVSIIHI
jgi:hypothetical protein